MKQSLKEITPFAEAFSRLLHPFAEVVLHDLEKGQIEAIYNPLSKRKIGDNSYLDSINLDDNTSVIGPYRKTNWDGMEMKSISIIVRDRSGQAHGMLCINMDISIFQTANYLIQSFINNDSPSVEKSQVLFADDLHEKINLFVKAYCQEKQIPIQMLTRLHKKEIILALWNEGAFREKNAANYVAGVLDVSRATVYNYLKEKEAL